MRKVAPLTLLLGLVLSYGILPASAVPMLSLAPASQAVSLGQNISFDVNIAGVADLYAFQFDLTFDPLLLSASSVVEGSFLASGGGTTFFDPGSTDNTQGKITFIVDTLIGPISGVNSSGTLATVAFQALGAGTALVTLSNAELLDSHLQDIPLSAVPEPATWLLLATGCVGLLGYGWRQRKKAV